jgi:hypothetical protein
MPSERPLPHSRPRHISVYPRGPSELHRRPSEPFRGHPRSVSAMVSNLGTGMIQAGDSTYSRAARYTNNAVVINGVRTRSVTSYLSGLSDGESRRRFLARNLKTNSLVGRHWKSQRAQLQNWESGHLREPMATVSGNLCQESPGCTKNSGNQTIAESNRPIPTCAGWTDEGARPMIYRFDSGYGRSEP